MHYLTLTYFNEIQFLDELFSNNVWLTEIINIRAYVWVSKKQNRKLSVSIHYTFRYTLI
ncbi:hypothetical protein CLV98_105222 [Dyadobacter jejuensis]|uniref:Uncharacterized protein n=1 Tax=Dyadobacter jejuensis TaxID=1082580 RepID=A0A316AKM0_9BACT|nr:hypothetical protein CLV98_105222 [Dyadobacter jejuensis]